MRARYTEFPDKSATLDELVKNEKAEGKTDATQALLWLTRGLSFTCKALQENLKNESLTLSKSFNESYETTLKPFHSFAVKLLIKASYIAVRTCIEGAKTIDRSRIGSFKCLS